MSCKFEELSDFNDLTFKLYFLRLSRFKRRVGMLRSKESHDGQQSPWTWPDELDESNALLTFQAAGLPSVVLVFAAVPLHVWVCNAVPTINEHFRA